MEKHKASDEVKKVENLHDVEMTHDELEHSKAVRDVKIKNRGVLQGEVQDHNIVVVGVVTDVFSDGQDQVVCVQTVQTGSCRRRQRAQTQWWGREWSTRCGCAWRQHGGGAGCTEGTGYSECVDALDVHDALEALEVHDALNA